MSWIDDLDEHQFLRTLFPHRDPPLEAIRLHEIALKQDGPIVMMRFDLPEYPAEPPAKWRNAQSDTVQVRLMGVGVRGLSIHGWATNNVGNLEIRRGDAAVRIGFESAECRVIATLDHCRVDSVTSYRAGDAG